MAHPGPSHVRRLRVQGSHCGRPWRRCGEDPGEAEIPWPSNRWGGWWRWPTLWWTYKKLWKMVIYSGFSHEKWWFSIAMLVHQRVRPKKQGFSGVGKCPNWTSPKYWGYNMIFHLQQIFEIIEGDVQHPQNGTFTNPCFFPIENGETSTCWTLTNIVNLFKPHGWCWLNENRNGDSNLINMVIFHGIFLHGFSIMEGREIPHQWSLFDYWWTYSKCCWLLQVSIVIYSNLSV